MRGLDHVEPCAVVTLSGKMIARTSSSSTSAAVRAAMAEPGRPQPVEKTARSCRASPPLGRSQAARKLDVQAGAACLMAGRSPNRSRRCRRMDAAWQADFDRAAPQASPARLLDFLEGEIDGRPRRFSFDLAFRECAERARTRTHG